MSFLEKCDECDGKGYFDIIGGPFCKGCPNNEIEYFLAMICDRCNKNKYDCTYSFKIDCYKCNRTGKVEWIENLFR